MTVLLVLGALLAVIAAWFLVRPLSSAASVSAHGENQDGLAQLRDRLLAQLRELDVETADRNVDPGVATDERRRLEADLAQVLKRLDAEPPGLGPVAVAASPGRRAAAVIVLAALVVLVSAGLYLAGHAPTLVQLAQLQNMPRDGSVPPMVLQMIAGLERRLAEQPADAEGWALLGRSYAVLGRQAEARQAYTRAVELAPQNTQILSAYAGFLLALDPAQPSSEATALFRRVQAVDPDNPSALWALGVVAYQEEDFRQAIEYWEQLLKQLPAGNEVEPQIQRALTEARARSQPSK